MIFFHETNNETRCYIDKNALIVRIRKLANLVSVFFHLHFCLLGIEERSRRFPPIVRFMTKPQLKMRRKTKTNKGSNC